MNISHILQPFNEQTGHAMYYDQFSMGKSTKTGATRFAYQKSRFSSLNLSDPNVFPLGFVDIFEGRFETDGTIKYENPIRFCEPTYSTQTLWPDTFEDASNQPATLYTSIDVNNKRSLKACFGLFESRVSYTHIFSSFLFPVKIN